MDPGGLAPQEDGIARPLDVGTGQAQPFPEAVHVVGAEQA